MSSEIKPKFKIGDKVKLNPSSGLNFKFEEAELKKTYTVEEVCWSYHAKDWYFQLSGIHSSYQKDWLVEA
jgi:hypothetical protein